MERHGTLARSDARAEGGTAIRPLVVPCGIRAPGDRCRHAGGGLSPPSPPVATVPGSGHLAMWLRDGDRPGPRRRGAQLGCLTYQMKASSNDGRVISTRSTRAVDMDSAIADPGSAPEGSDTRMLVPRRLVPGQRAASSA